MRLAISGAAVAIILVGCGGDQPTRSVKATRTAPPARPPTSHTATVTLATTQISVSTHHGADGLSGLKVAGTCDGTTVVVDVGHAPPYLPLRTVGIPDIDATTPPGRSPLTARCSDGHFKISRRNLAVRLGAGPLTAKPRAANGNAVTVRVKAHAIE